MRVLVSIAAHLILIVFCAAAAEPKSGEAPRAASQQGDFEAAVRRWDAAIAARRRAKDPGALIDALLGRAHAEHQLGQHRLAVASAIEARDLASKGGDRARFIAALEALGSFRIFAHDAEWAEGPLREALALARKAGDQAREAATLNDLGILLDGQGKAAEALKAFRDAAKLAKGAANPALAAKAHANAADSAARSGDFAAATEQNRGALAVAKTLPDSHDKAFVLSRAGQTWELLFQLAPAHDQKLRLAALEAYRAAENSAEAAGDQRALSYALGYSGHLYEQEKKFGEAAALTRRAAFLAQQSQAPELLYQWEWQTARIERGEGRPEEAIAAYRRAIGQLERIRGDLSSRLGNIHARSSFRQAVGDVFFELADLLLQRADRLRDPEQIAQALREARDTCETLKSVELEDYFQDDCVNLLRAKAKPVENLAPTAAILYLIPLPDRTEILVSVQGRLERVKAPVAAPLLTATVRAFRRHLETRTTEEFLDEAQQLHAWLIRPLEPLLRRAKIDTLVFIPDGALRSIPMGALHDGEKFLVERYAIAVTPGLTLMEPAPIKRVNVTLMANGLTAAVRSEGEDYPALPFVREEIARLRKLYGGTALIDRDFRVPAVQKAFAEQPFSVVHIASHGEFSGDVRKTFLLTFDDRLTLDGLERLIRPAQLREQPVELLSLSACQTAAGDDRAALGLAGVALKAGARSAFATLWNVNDEASTTLVSDFYTLLRNAPDISKAQALQRAQIKMLNQPLTSHPCLWAPYMIIGNWL